MKNNIYKTKIVAIAISFLMLLNISCSDDSDILSYKTGDLQSVVDPYVIINSSVISFQAGTPLYGLDFTIINGTKDITSVEAYSVFTDASSGNSSEKTFLKSYPVTSETKTITIDSLNYSNLKSGLTVDGAALPESDLDLAIGSGWKVSFVGMRPDGTEIPLAGSINIAVLSRFAGIYRVVDMKYWRIGEDRDDVYASEIGNTRFIGSVDENTFSYNDYWGPFGWTGASFNFEIDFTDNSITVPIIVAGLFSGNYATNCTDNADLLTNVPCDGTTNILTPDDVTGKHRIVLTYGYFTEGSGAREFWEILEKVVD